MEGRPHTVGARYYERSECFWNRKYEHLRNKTAREDALQEIVQELNFPELTAEEEN
jgi:hypothetical protein